MPLLELQGVWYKYPGAPDYALRDVSLVVGEGQAYIVAGPNGAGKTTLLLVMAGLLEPERGEVLFKGRPLKEQLPGARRHIGLLFQNPEHMLFNPVVYDEIAYVPRQLYASEEDVRRAVEEAAEMVGLKHELLNRPTHMLSYGEKKLVALASILSYKPQLILLDEPYTNLSQEYVGKINSIISRHISDGGSAVIVCHECVGNALGVDASVLYMESGRIKPLTR
jgi:cobalt/nickel transport system ATP-binding protein